LSNILSKNPTNGQNKVPGECWFHHSYCRQETIAQQLYHIELSQITDDLPMWLCTHSYAHIVCDYAVNHS